MKRIPILGQQVAVADYSSAVSEILRMARDRTRAYAVEAANTMVVTLARHESPFREVMDQFDLVVPDGMPLVWCMNRRLAPEARLTDRVYGPELMLRVFAATRNQTDLGHFLLGGTPEILSELRMKLTKQFPEATIAGTHSPPFGEWPMEEHEQIFEQIRHSGASLVWVGLGCPKQERWIARWKEKLPPAVYFGIGAAFAFHAGKVKSAPDWMQRAGLEWAFRLVVEPRRLFGRYVKYNSLFLKYLVTDGLSSDEAGA